MNDAINALAPCPFCNSPAEDDGLRPYRALGSSRLGHGYAIYCTKCDADMMVCYEDHTGVDREALAADLRDRWNTRASTPKATVEREAIARTIDPQAFINLQSERDWAAQYGKPDSFWLPYQKLCDEALTKADAILAVRLDEAAIRADEREKCALDLERSYPDHAWLNAACAAIRGGKQP